MAEALNGFFGVVVVDGGTIVYCDISGFFRGILVGPGDNTVSDSSVSGGGVGIEVKGGGCNTIASVSSTGNRDSGILIGGGGGTVVISDYTSFLDKYGIYEVPWRLLIPPFTRADSLTILRKKFNSTYSEATRFHTQVNTAFNQSIRRLPSMAIRTS